MSYWRKFILVVLLALCVPIQSFAAVSTQCAGAAVPHAGADAPVAPHAMPSVHGEHAREAAPCPACGPCCFGSGIAQVPAVPVTSDAGLAIVSSVPSTVAVSFLTGGIDRPPRRNPV
ncbi:hypothetical protein WT27_25620 [Burkholderia territorii]|uniref:DUF2946 domain-containing protein n=1 Tax=Burkholderia territorii TaxID=1503055 RepID=A0A125ADY2_9BURK|nr:hypothetical protein [Burkholderia territorii]KVV55578.1 hypothetical protein WT27_25620 [Burkholderia territorii]KVX46331.1 hypothetical protein WT31_22700 [Burkholderia territorii]